MQLHKRKSGILFQWIYFTSSSRMLMTKLQKAFHVPLI